MPIIASDPATRGRDLEVLTIEVLAAGSRTTLNSVVCPKEHRARSLADCEPCTDGRGAASDPTDRPGWFSCAASEGPPAEQRDAESAADRTPVTAVMTRAIVAFCTDLPVDRARDEMLGRGLDTVAVVDRAGRPLGLLGLAELLRGPQPAPAATRVEDVMERRIFPVADGARVSDAAAVMAAERAVVVPVVAREGQVVGLVTALDLVTWLAAQDDRGARRLP